MDIKTISILGAGWLGLPLGRHLRQEGYQVKGGTTSADKLPQLEANGLAPYLFTVNATGMQGKVDDFFASDLLIITLPPGGRRDPAAARAYPGKIEQILRAATMVSVSRLLFTSSTGIYGPIAGPVNETTPPQARTASGRALARVEAMFRRQPVPVTILRLAGLAGPHRHPGRWFGGREHVPGGEEAVNLVHQQDVIRFILAVITQSAWGHTFNVCADEHPLKRDYYPFAAAQLGLAPPTFEEPTERGGGKIIDNRFGKTELGFVYRYPDPFGFEYLP